MVITNSIAAIRINSPSERIPYILQPKLEVALIDLSVGNPNFSTPGTQHCVRNTISVTFNLDPLKLVPPGT